MKKLVIIAVCVLGLFGCQTLMEWTGGVAGNLADWKERYCAELDLNARETIRNEYNAEMDARGLPHDQINCPE